MKFEERVAIIEKLNLWEKKYPVDIWMIEGVPIWPILKKEIFFNLYIKFNESSGKLKTNKTSLLTRVFNKITTKPKAWLLLKLIKIEEVNFLFSGASSHRVDWKGSQFNRYFDPIMDYLEKNGESSFLLEYHKVNVNFVYKPLRVFNLTEMLPVFAKRRNFDKAWGRLKVSSEFNEFFKEISEETSLTGDKLKNKITRNIQVVLNWAALYEYFFKKTKAKYSFGICYYNKEMLGMNLAAKRLDVISIDMQHGTQGDLHFAYHFSKSPEKGYNILPDIFWVWDDASFKNIAKWVKNKNNKLVLGGNPWIEFLRDDALVPQIYKDDSKPMILFTLQPLAPIIDDYFLEVISLTCHRYSWWLRLHPRMTKAEVAGLNLKLGEFKIQGIVNIQDASNEPLPVLLKECHLHVSKYSGSIAEAALIQKTSLIIDEIGVKSFKDLLENKIAVACLTKKPLGIIELIENILNNPELPTGNQVQVPTCYKMIIDEFITKT